MSAWSIIGWSSFLSAHRSRPVSRAGVHTQSSKLDLRGLASQLLHVAGRCAVDGDLLRLHRLGYFPEQLNLQQAIIECLGALTWT